MASSEPPEAFLVRVTESGQREVHAARGTRIVLGRAADSDLVLKDPGVSRRHALLAWDGGQFQLEDLGSTNGTRLNGVLISTRTPVRDGDEIELADCRLQLQMTSPDTTIVLRRPAARLDIDLSTHEVRVQGELVELTPKEYLLLALLYRREGAVVSRDEIAREVWPELASAVAGQDIQQLVARLRRGLRETAASPRHILTVRGFGYRLDLAQKRTPRS